ncbi:MAG: NAD(P)-binding domain-containing protein [Pseudomonadota bacterium]
MSNIAIIGAGVVGVALAQNWILKGHKATLGVRDPASASAQEARAQLGDAVQITEFSDAIAAAEIITIALPWDAVEEVLPRLQGTEGKVVIDATNPLGMTDDGFGLVIGHSASGGEEVARLLPNARVVKSLNQVGAEILADPTTLPQQPVMFVAGDDAEARQTALALVADLGFDVHDFGPLRGARMLEAFAMTWINFAVLQGAGRNWGFARSVSKGGEA